MTCSKCGKPTFTDNIGTGTGGSMVITDDSCVTVTTSLCVCNSYDSCFFCDSPCIKEVSYDGKTLHLCQLHKDATKGSLIDSYTQQYKYVWSNNTSPWIIPNTCNCPLTGPCSCSWGVQFW